MADTVLNFLRHVTGIPLARFDERAGTVSLRLLLNRIGYAPDPDPEMADWDYEGLAERYCGGGDALPVQSIPLVLCHLHTDNLGKEWRSAHAAFLAEVWGAVPVEPTLKAATSRLLRDVGLPEEEA